MNIFISWSGERSKLIAGALSEWLPEVLEGARTWMSGHDIDAGTRWLPGLSRVLEESQFGIVCLTPENQRVAWVLFEAGALSKSLQESKLIPLLIGMSPSDVEPPLSQFQSVSIDQIGVLKLLQSINSASEAPLSPERLRKRFEKWWPEIDGRLQDALRQPAPTLINKRSEYDLVTEILEILRSINKRAVLDSRNIVGHHVGSSPKQCDIILDTRRLMGEKGKVTKIPVTDDTTVTTFLDKVYLLIQYNVRPYTYGERWGLLNNRTNEVCDFGVQYSRSRGKMRDESSLLNSGVSPGDTLIVVPVERPGPGRTKQGDLGR